jgi:DNA-binding NtrC family response regulator/tetratricopeptide (TPR) repeat protein
MEKNIGRNRLEFSEPLSYIFIPSLKNYEMNKLVDPKSRLFVDSVKYFIKHVDEQKLPVFRDAFDSLLVFKDAMNDFTRWRPRYLYDIDWEELGLDRFIRLNGVELSDDINIDDYSDEGDDYFNYEHYIQNPDYFRHESLVSWGHIFRLTNKHNIHSILDLFEKEYNDPDIKSVIAAMYISAEKFDEAIRVYKDKDQKEPYDYYNLGVVYLLEKKDYTKARDFFLKAIGLKEARYNTGMTYIYENDLLRALEQFGFLAKACPSGGSIDNKIEKMTDLISSEKLYISDLARVLPNDYMDYALSDLDLAFSTDFNSDSEMSDENSYTYISICDTVDTMGWDGQVVRLESVMTQMSCNNIGVCGYYIDNNIIKALDWFETALSWDKVTGLKIGRNNIRCLVETPISIEELRQQEDKFETVENMIGNSDSMKKVYRLINQFADVEANVLITGETGTGKERVANAIHKLSKRKDNSFISVNCGAFSETLLESELFGHEKGAFTGATKTKKGIFELANEGTVFFDEIGEATLLTQVKLLRVIQEKKFMRLGGEKLITTNVRIIFATNKDLLEEIKKETFRKDLYYRIYGCRIHMPPLRKRKEDIPFLTSQFIKQAAEKNQKKVLGISERVLSLLNDLDWPGNVRQLENVVEALVVNARGQSIQLSDFTDELRSEVLNGLENINDKEHILTREEYIEILEKSGLTEEVFADSLDLSRVFISNMKSGIRNISMKTSKKIIEKYGYLISM